MSHNIKNLEAEVRAGSSPVRRTGRWQPKASMVETVTRSKKELPTQSLSCTQVSWTLGHALSVMRSKDKKKLTGGGGSRPHDPQWRTEQWAGDDET
jgi:hypothetical protein